MKPRGVPHTWCGDVEIGETELSRDRCVAELVRLALLLAEADAERERVRLERIEQEVQRAARAAETARARAAIVAANQGISLDDAMAQVLEADSERLDSGTQ